MDKIKYLFLFLFLSYGLGFSQSFQVNKQIKGLELPSENIRSIVQDKKGKMWFSTSRGVYCSDGISTYGLPEHIQKELDGVVNLVLDKDGDIWLHNSTGALKVFSLEEGNWEKYALGEASKVFEGSDAVYFGVEGKGEDKTIIVGRSGMVGVNRVGTAEWEILEFPNEGWGELKSIFKFGEQHFCLLFEKAAAKVIEGNVLPLALKSPDGVDPVWDIAFDEDRNIYYFLGDDFLAKGKTPFLAEEFVAEGFSKLNYDTNKQFGLQVKNGQVYYFYCSQLFKYNPETKSILEITTFDALKAFYINTAFVDRENIIWIGTLRGVLNLPTLRFQNFDESDGMMENEVSAIEPLGRDEILFGFNNGFQLWEADKVVFESKGIGEPGEPKNRVTSFHRDKNGIIWLASSARGVGRFDPHKREAEFTPSPNSPFVVNIAPKGDSLFIVAGQQIYLSHINARGKELFENNITDSIFSRVLHMEIHSIRKINFDSKGKLIILSGGRTNHDNLVESNEAFTFFRGYDWEPMGDSLLLGTPEGLKIFDGEKTRYYTVNEQRVDRPVYAILKDINGNIWAGTDKGVAIIDQKTIRYFDTKNGLSGNEINRGALVNWGRTGRVMIGTQNGLSVYIPEEDAVMESQPLVSVDHLSVLGGEPGEVSITEIPYQHNNIVFEYSATSFLQFGNLTISYKLIGYHDKWQKIINPRTNILQFNNLPPGDYQLVLKASHGGQFESNSAYSAKFSVTKPVYMQFWFVGLLMLFFLIIGFGMSVLVNQFKERGILQRSIDERDQKIRIAEDQFRNVWESSQEGLVLLRNDGRVLAINPALKKMAGLDSLGKSTVHHVRDLFKDQAFYYKNSRRLIKALERSSGKGGAFEVVLPFYSGDKSIDLFVTRVNPKHEENEVILMVFRDVTNKKIYEKGLKEAKEKAEEANRVKTNFLSNMSHEIRTPLNGILGSTENIILQKQENKTLVGQLEIIKESGERLLNTINSILDMSKIEANKMEVVYEEVNVNDFLAKILLPLKTLALKKNLLLTAKFETKPLIAKVDKRYLEMIINNIVGNSIKYSDEGLIQLYVKKADEHIFLKIKDSGIGMGEEFIKHVFTPFEQESGGYNRKFEGTGLGLTITKHLVDLLGGTIEIKSKRKEGTTVEVKLPVN